MNADMRHRGSGFLLLEMILALAIFSMAATGFIVALHRMSKVVARAQSELKITQVLESALNEAMAMPTLEAGETDLENGSGFAIHRLIEPVEGLENQDGLELNEIYRIRITARWYDSSNWQERVAETWRYGPMYQP
jgi:type II secretory pathway pseudopilin PulG